VVELVADELMVVLLGGWNGGERERERERKRQQKKRKTREGGRFFGRIRTQFASYLHREKISALDSVGEDPNR
jgi:hypothetical protein